MTAITTKRTESVWDRIRQIEIEADNWQRDWNPEGHFDYLIKALGTMQGLVFDLEKEWCDKYGFEFGAEDKKTILDEFEKRMGE